jgi:SAM-dependent methyltransferase
MPDIEQRVEATTRDPNYATRTFSDDQVAAGMHRDFVGGKWDSHGRRQLDFLTRSGLKRHDTLVDIGAGALRAGRHLVDYLEPGHYFAVDVNLPLLELGYEVELTPEQRGRLPARNLRATDRFDTDFGVVFDIAIAQSVFTHLSLNYLRLCLFRLAKVMRTGGRFYVTYFEEPDDTPLDAIVRRRQNGRPKYYERNVYWYYRDDLTWAVRDLPWSYRYIGDWGHPTGQRMVEYTRTEGVVQQQQQQQPTRTLGYRARRWLAGRIAP